MTHPRHRLDTVFSVRYTYSFTSHKTSQATSARKKCTVYDSTAARPFDGLEGGAARHRYRAGWHTSRTSARAGDHVARGRGNFTVLP